MTQLTPLRPIPFYALSGVNADSAPRALFAILDFATATQWEGDLLSQLQSKRFQSLRTIYFDAMDCASPVTILFPQTQQRLVIEPATWGYMPVIVSDQMQFQISGTAPDRFRLHLLNMDFEPVVGGNTTYTPPIPFSDIEMTGPALLGREAASLGPAQEIGLGTDFAIVGGNLELTGDPGGPFVLKAGDTMTGPLRISGPLDGLTEANAAFVLEGTDAGANGPTCVMWHNSPSPAVSDAMRVRNYFNNSLGVPFIATQLLSGITSLVAGSESSRLVVATTISGAFAFRLIIGAGVYSSSLADQGDNTINFGSYYAGGFLSIDANALLRRRVLTFGTLPAAAGIAGAEADITDGAAAPAWLAAAAGGGAQFTPVHSNGVAWING